MERPLRLSFALTPARLARVNTLMLPEEVKARAVAALTPGVADTAYPSRAAFVPVVQALYVAARQTPPTARHLRLMLEKALGEPDAGAEPFTEDDGKPITDPDLRDFENVPLKEDIDTYFAREVLPHVLDAWINTSKRDEADKGVGVVGYEIPFTRHFYEYAPLRALDEIEAKIAALETQIQGMLREAMK